MLLRDDREHADRCHHRWCERMNRHQYDKNYKDEWYAQQCGACSFFIPLIGALCEDWGVCSNAATPFDGTVRFEHDGCDLFQSSGEWD